MGACSSKNAVKKAPSDDSSTDRESLFTAVETDDEQSVAKLLKRGVDVDARDSNEYTALILAAETGATASVGTLAVVMLEILLTLHKALVEPQVPGQVTIPHNSDIAKQAVERLEDELVLHSDPSPLRCHVNKKVLCTR